MMTKVTAVIARIVGMNQSIRLTVNRNIDYSPRRSFDQMPIANRFAMPTTHATRHCERCAKVLWRGHGQHRPPDRLIFMST
jgi:hypothetical protein